MKHRRKNPYDIESIIDFFEKNSSYFKYFMSGPSEAYLYYFELDRTLVLPLNGILLNKGKYILRILYNNRVYSKGAIDKLELLSKYGVIPKIYFVKENIMISKYIDGETYLEFKVKNKFNEKRKIVDDKIKNLMNIYDKLNLHHGDLNPTNILISKNLNVYFIDPDVKY